MTHEFHYEYINYRKSGTIIDNFTPLTMIKRGNVHTHHFFTANSCEVQKHGVTWVLLGRWLEYCKTNHSPLVHNSIAMHILASPV
jgi:hypothetical protein